MIWKVFIFLVRACFGIYRLVERGGYIVWRGAFCSFVFIMLLHSGSMKSPVKVVPQQYVRNLAKCFADPIKDAATLMEN